MLDVIVRDVLKVVAATSHWQQGSAYLESLLVVFQDFLGFHEATIQVEGNGQPNPVRAEVWAHSQEGMTSLYECVVLP